MSNLVRHCIERDVSPQKPERDSSMTNSAHSERNIATVKKLLDEVINTGRIELCGNYLAADRVDYQDYGLPDGAANGHEGFKAVLRPFLDAFPDLHLQIEFTITDGDRLVVYLTTTGTHTNPFMGMPSTGKQFTVSGVDIFRFNDDGKISAH